MKKVMKAVILSVLSLAAGYVAIAVPFNLFRVLGTEQMHWIFFGEVLIYSAIGCVFIALHQKQLTEKQRSKARHEERSRKIREVQSTWYDIAA